MDEERDPRYEPAEPAEPTPEPVPDPTPEPARRGRRWTLILIIGGLALACACFAGVGVLFGGIVLTSSAGPKEAVTRYYDAARAGDYATARAQLTQGFAAEMTPDDLREVFAASEAQDGPIVDVTFGDVRIEDNFATVETIVLRERAGGTLFVELAKNGDVWLIDNFVAQ